MTLPPSLSSRWVGVVSVTVSVAFVTCAEQSAPIGGVHARLVLRGAVSLPVGDQLAICVLALLGELGSSARGFVSVSDGRANA